MPIILSKNDVIILNYLYNQLSDSRSANCREYIKFYELEIVEYIKNVFEENKKLDKIEESCYIKLE